jgi:hypothetical protein
MLIPSEPYGFVLLAIALPVLFQFTDSDYFFGIIKLLSQ